MEEEKITRFLNDFRKADKLAFFGTKITELSHENLLALCYWQYQENENTEFKDNKIKKFMQIK